MAKSEKINLPALIVQAETRIADVIPPGMDAGRVVRLAKLAVYRTPKLLECDPISVIDAILQAAQLGLEIASPIGGAHLVPFKRKCMMIPDYRALIRLALRHPDLYKLVAREVYRGDQFNVMQGTTEHIEHVPLLTNEPRMDEDITGFYAVATLKGPMSVLTHHEYAPRGDIEKIRERAPAGRDGPWATDFAAMGKKTMIKRLCKFLDLTPELAQAIEYDNRGEMGFGATTLDGDTEESVAADMSEKARQAQDEMKSNMEEDRRTEIQGNEG